jgi:hypothetical protein
MTQKTVILDVDVEGYHSYPDAPEAVSFLRGVHRHLFRVRVGLVVSDKNREREIFLEQNALCVSIESVYGKPAQFGSLSCEAISEWILSVVQGSVWCEVLEDGRGGARIDR